MSSVALPVAVLDEAPKTLGLSRVSAPFSRLWSEDSMGVQVIVSSTAQFVRRMAAGVVRRRAERLLLLAPLEAGTLDSVESRFDAVVTTEPTPDLVEILRADNRAELLLRAVYDPVAQHIVIHRGDLSVLVVPIDWFTSPAGGPSPDVTRVRVIDTGQTLALGAYEAAADAMLYEFDPDYRRRVKKNALERDTSFGGSLRRLRLQKGLLRSDFAPMLSDKTVARIERGEVGKPHDATLRMLAKRLGVRVEALASY